MKKLEKIIVIVIVLLSLLAIGIPMLTKSNPQTSKIIISVDNKVVKKIAMNNSDEVKKFDFNFNNHIGYIETQNGKVRILEMSKELCPNSICADTGWIDQTYQLTLSR
ncbi:MAG TPA: NusG domain II-containing protein [Desulfosporosinus sp.]|nr:NusG domain II-containing protein [Desulfosporosinus sp.]